MPGRTEPSTELWDLDTPRLPARSRLYSLPPIGVATRDAESLSSYVGRLAAAHTVDVRSLMRWEVYPHMEPRRSLRRWALNGSGRMAHKAVAALEELTGRHDLRYLTFVPWAEVLHATPMLRHYKAWCRWCYAEWQEAQCVVYEPLVWAVQGVESCIHHGVALAMACPYADCRAQSSPLSARTLPGYCDACRRWLGSSPRDGVPDVRLPQELEAIAGLFIEHADDGPGRVTRERSSPVTGWRAWRILARKLWP